MTRFIATFVTLFAILPLALSVPRPDHHGRQVGRQGQATWFEVGLDACGGHNKNSDHIGAISDKIYDRGKHCGKRAHIMNKSNGKKVDIVIVDECPGCPANNVDLSPSAFVQLGSLGEGVLDIVWDFY